MKSFLADPVSAPHRPDHLVADFNTKADEFHDKLDEYYAQRDVRRESTKAFLKASTAIREKLRWMQMALPTLTPGDDEILEPFGLHIDVPSDNDEMKNYADAVNAHWQTVRTDPQFSVFQSDIDELATLLTDYDTAQSVQTDEEQKEFLLQNEKDAIRDELEEQVMALLDWYRIYYKDPNDEYWTQTPWGKASQEGSGDVLPPVEGLGLEFLDPELRIYWDDMPGADGYKLYVGNNPVLLTTTLYIGSDTEHTYDPPGGHHYYKVWAMKGDKLGLPCDAVDIEIVGTPPPKPHGLKLVRDGDRVRIEWKHSGETPQYFNLYIAIVPTGSSAPSMPDVPYEDEIITNFVSIFAPAVGNTVYAWVTAFGDGAESDPEGPRHIDIV